MTSTMHVYKYKVGCTLCSKTHVIYACCGDSVKKPKRPKHNNTTTQNPKP